MKKYIIILSITLFSIVSIGNSGAEEILQHEPVEAVTVSQEPIIEKPSNIFIARNLDGYIAIFVPDEILPILTTDINVKTLPLADQKMLETGITIDENYGLAKFIEDYSS